MCPRAGALKKIAAAMTGLLLVRRFDLVALAVGVDNAGVRGSGGAAAAASSAAASLSLKPTQDVIHITASDAHRRDRSLIVGGTPTGGSKYPFLVVVHWADAMQDPRGPLGIWCHGTMVAPDVVLVSFSCRPDHGYVMVGDSRNGTSIQFRNVVSNDTIYHGLVSHPDGYHHLFRIEPVTFPGFYPAKINKDPDGVFIGQEITVVGYGARNEANSSSWPGEAYEAQLTVIDYWGNHFGALAFGSGACGGDGSAPVLDSSKALIGIANWIYCGTSPDVYVRVSHVAEWIERNTCALSARKDSIPFCSKVVCPADARLLGYPWALLPNGTGSVVGIRGFIPVRATQWPPPGTPLWRNTTTNVTITAFDVMGQKRVCNWVVLVAPLVALGEVTIDLPNGTYTAAGSFAVSRATQILSGRVYKMSGRTSDQLRGRGSSVTARLRKRSSRFHGKALTLKQYQTNASVLIPNVPIRFGIDAQHEQNDVQVHVNVTQNEGKNNITYKLFGQVQEYLF